MKIVNQNEKSEEDIIKEACVVLAAGGMVVIPTDTVYGLAVDAKNAEAVQKLIDFKGQARSNPISVFIGTIDSVERYCEISQDQKAMIDTLLPGPYTVILPSKHTLNENIEAGTGSLGIRVPQNNFVNNLVLAFGSPITATSTNPIGNQPSHSIDAMLKQLSDKKKDKLDLIIDFGKLLSRQTSTVINLAHEEILFQRRGDSVPILEKHDSRSVDDTRKIAGELFEKYIHPSIKAKPVVILFEGPMGVGKTVFTKGLGEYLEVQDKIVSPTFVIVYEYDVNKKDVKRLYHFDLYRLEDNEEFNHLGIEEMLTPGSLLCMEWGEKSTPILSLLKEKAEVLLVQMKHIRETEREIGLVKIG